MVDGEMEKSEDIDFEKLMLFTRLKKTEERYRTLVELANIGIFSLKGAEIEYANPEFTNMFGYSPTELKGIGLLDLIHPDDRDDMMVYLRRAQKGDALRCRGIDKNNNIMLLEWSIIPTRIGDTVGALGTVRNLVQIEKVLREREHLYSELQDAYEELKKADEEKVAFIEALAHEVRTPLTAVYGYLEFLKSSSVIEKDGELLRYVQNIEKGVNRIREIADYIAEMGAVDKTELNWQHVELASLVGDVVDNMSNVAAEKGLEFRCSFIEV
ncbi:MAG: PAS domain S-box protein, partial [Methermicoccaceae archaeon]